MAAALGSAAAGLDRLPPEDWETMRAHVHAADFPETSSRWPSPGRKAGFSRVREAFVAPSDLFRLCCMSAGAP